MADDKQQRPPPQGKRPGRPSGPGWIKFRRAWLTHPLRQKLTLAYAEVHTRLLAAACRGYKYPQLAGLLCDEAGVPFTETEMAARIGVPRRTLQRAITAMVDLGPEPPFPSLLWWILVDGRRCLELPGYRELVAAATSWPEQLATAEKGTGPAVLRLPELAPEDAGGSAKVARPVRQSGAKAAPKRRKPSAKVAQPRAAKKAPKWRSGHDGGNGAEHVAVQGAEPSPGAEFGANRTGVSTDPKPEEEESREHREGKPEKAGGGDGPAREPETAQETEGGDTGERRIARGRDAQTVLAEASLRNLGYGPEERQAILGEEEGAWIRRVLNVTGDAENRWPDRERRRAHVEARLNLAGRLKRARQGKAGRKKPPRVTRDGGAQ